jgi:hypothetical protein
MLCEFLSRMRTVDLMQYREYVDGLPKVGLAAVKVSREALLQVAEALS